MSHTIITEQDARAIGRLIEDELDGIDPERREVAFLVAHRLRSTDGDVEIRTHMPEVKMIPPYPHPWWEDVAAGDLIAMPGDEKLYRVLEAGPNGARVEVVLPRP